MAGCSFHVHVMQLNCGPVTGQCGKLCVSGWVVLQIGRTHAFNSTSRRRCVENNTISEECTTADKKTEELAIFSLHC